MKRKKICMLLVVVMMMTAFTGLGITAFAEETTNVITDSTKKNLENPFSDVDEKDWFYNDVMNIYSEKIMLGTSDTMFSPNVSTTRGMIVTLLYRLSGEPEVSNPSMFRDVEEGAWYSDAVSWASENLIVLGYGNGLFGSNDNVTREQIATILYRYYNTFDYEELVVDSDSEKNNQGNIEENTSVDENFNSQMEEETYETDIIDPKTSFPDGDKISSYAIEPLTWACSNSLVNGNADGTLNPGGDATRCQIAAIVTRYLDNSEDDNELSAASVYGGENTRTINVQTKSNWWIPGSESITLKQNKCKYSYQKFKLFRGEWVTKTSTMYPNYSIIIRNNNTGKIKRKTWSTGKIKISLDRNSNYTITVSYDSTMTWLGSNAKFSKWLSNPYWWVSGAWKVNYW